MTASAPSPLSAAERAALSASLGESHFREYKSALHGAPGAKARRAVADICRDISMTLVAFANADGGELLVGVEDSGEITGLADFDRRALDMFLNAPKTHVHQETPLISVSGALTSVTGKSILYFSIPKSQSAIHLTSDGKCLQRRDLESVPVAPRQIQLDRQETRSREYDREYVDGASLSDLNTVMVQAVADQISRGMSPEKCLQYLGLADFQPPIGLRLRRAAVLLFANRPDSFHPRLQVRILKVNGPELGTGAKYNVTSDDIVRGNLFELRESSSSEKLGGKSCERI
jgi:ATP-dependent DNA helicase RecG